MRIIYHHRLGSKDGQFVHVEEIVAALRQLGQEVMIVGPTVLERAEFGGNSGLITSVKRAMPRAAYECLEFGYGVLASRRLLRAARRFRPEVIYERFSLHLPAGCIVARSLGIPLLLEVNAPLAAERAAFGGLGLDRFARWSEARTWRAADAVLAVSHQLADLVVAAGVAPARVHTVPNGVDTGRFAAGLDVGAARAALGLSDRRVVGFTGFMREWHGLDRLVTWLATRAPADVVVCLVGDGPARAGLERQAADLGVADRLLITGVVARTEIPRWLATFDVAVQPDVVGYASPLKLIEYMAAGRAIIAPDRPNIRDLLTDDVDALLVAPDRIDEALDRLLRDDALRKRLGTGACATVAKCDLTWVGNAKRILQIARQACDARRAGPWLDCASEQRSGG